MLCTLEPVSVFDCADDDQRNLQRGRQQERGRNSSRCRFNEDDGQNQKILGDRGPSPAMAEREPPCAPGWRSLLHVCRDQTTTISAGGLPSIIFPLKGDSITTHEQSYSRQDLCPCNRTNKTLRPSTQRRLAMAVFSYLALLLAVGAEACFELSGQQVSCNMNSAGCFYCSETSTCFDAIDASLCSSMIDVCSSWNAQPSLCASYFYDRTAGQWGTSGLACMGAADCTTCGFCYQTQQCMSVDQLPASCSSSPFWNWCNNFNGQQYACNMAPAPAYCTDPSGSCGNCGWCAVSRRCEAYSNLSSATCCGWTDACSSWSTNNPSSIDAWTCTRYRRANGTWVMCDPNSYTFSSCQCGVNKVKGTCSALSDPCEGFGQPSLQYCSIYQYNSGTASFSSNSNSCPNCTACAHCPTVKGCMRLSTLSNVTCPGLKSLCDRYSAAGSYYCNQDASCAFCPATATCIMKATVSSCTSPCAAFRYDQSGCYGFGCNYCMLNGTCVNKTLGMCIPPCSTFSSNSPLCQVNGCVYCPQTNACVDSLGKCDVCRSYDNNQWTCNNYVYDVNGSYFTQFMYANPADTLIQCQYCTATQYCFSVATVSSLCPSNTEACNRWNGDVYNCGLEPNCTYCPGQNNSCISVTRAASGTADCTLCYLRDGQGAEACNTRVYNSPLMSLSNACLRPPCQTCGYCSSTRRCRNASMLSSQTCPNWSGDVCGAWNNQSAFCANVALDVAQDGNLTWTTQPGCSSPPCEPLSACAYCQQTNKCYLQQNIALMCSSWTSCGYFSNNTISCAAYAIDSTSAWVSSGITCGNPPCTQCAYCRASRVCMLRADINPLACGSYEEPCSVFGSRELCNFADPGSGATCGWCSSLGKCSDIMTLPILCTNYTGQCNLFSGNQISCNYNSDENANQCSYCLSNNTCMTIDNFRAGCANFVDDCSAWDGNTVNCLSSSCGYCPMTKLCTLAGCSPTCLDWGRDQDGCTGAGCYFCYNNQCVNTWSDCDDCNTFSSQGQDKCNQMTVTPGYSAQPNCYTTPCYICAWCPELSICTTFNTDSNTSSQCPNMFDRCQRWTGSSNMSVNCLNDPSCIVCPSDVNASLDQCQTAAFFQCPATCSQFAGSQGACTRYGCATCPSWVTATNPAAGQMCLDLDYSVLTNHFCGCFNNSQSSCNSYQLSMNTGIWVTSCPVDDACVTCAYCQSSGECIRQDQIDSATCAGFTDLCGSFSGPGNQYTCQNLVNCYYCQASAVCMDVSVAAGCATPPSVIYDQTTCTRAGFTFCSSYFRCIDPSVTSCSSCLYGSNYKLGCQTNVATCSFCDSTGQCFLASEIDSVKCPGYVDECSLIANTTDCNFFLWDLTAQKGVAVCPQSDTCIPCGYCAASRSCMYQTSLASNCAFVSDVCSTWNDNSSMCFNVGLNSYTSTWQMLPCLPGICTMCGWNADTVECRTVDYLAGTGTSYYLEPCEIYATDKTCGTRAFVYDPVAHFAAPCVGSCCTGSTIATCNACAGPSSCCTNYTSPSTSPPTPQPAPNSPTPAPPTPYPTPAPPSPSGTFTVYSDMTISTLTIDKTFTQGVVLLRCNILSTVSVNFTDIRPPAQGPQVVFFVAVNSTFRIDGIYQNPFFVYGWSSSALAAASGVAVNFTLTNCSLSSVISLAFAGAFPPNSFFTLTRLKVNFSLPSNSNGNAAFISLTSFILAGNSNFSMISCNFSLTSTLMSTFSLVRGDSIVIANGSSLLLNASTVSVAAGGTVTIFSLSSYSPLEVKGSSKIEISNNVLRLASVYNSTAIVAQGTGGFYGGILVSNGAIVNIFGNAVNMTGAQQNTLFLVEGPTAVFENSAALMIESTTVINPTGWFYVFAHTSSNGFSGGQNAVLRVAYNWFEFQYSSFVSLALVLNFDTTSIFQNVGNAYRPSGLDVLKNLFNAAVFTMNYTAHCNTYWSTIMTGLYWNWETVAQGNNCDFTTCSVEADCFPTNGISSSWRNSSGRCFCDASCKSNARSFNCFPPFAPIPTALANAAIYLDATNYTSLPLTNMQFSNVQLTIDVTNIPTDLSITGTSFSNGSHVTIRGFPSSSSDSFLRAQNWVHVVFSQNTLLNSTLLITGAWSPGSSVEVSTIAATVTRFTPNMVNLFPFGTIGAISLKALKILRATVQVTSVTASVVSSQFNTTVLHLSNVTVNSGELSILGPSSLTALASDAFSASALSISQGITLMNSASLLIRNVAGYASHTIVNSTANSSLGGAAFLQALGAPVTITTGSTLQIFAPMAILYGSGVNKSTTRFIKIGTLNMSGDAFFSVSQLFLSATNCKFNFLETSNVALGLYSMWFLSDLRLSLSSVSTTGLALPAFQKVTIDPKSAFSLSMFQISGTDPSGYKALLQAQNFSSSRFFTKCITVNGVVQTNKSWNWESAQPLACTACSRNTDCFSPNTIDVVTISSSSCECECNKQGYLYPPTQVSCAPPFSDRITRTVPLQGPTTFTNALFDTSLVFDSTFSDGINMINCDVTVQLIVEFSMINVVRGGSIFLNIRNTTFVAPPTNPGSGQATAFEVIFRGWDAVPPENLGVLITLSGCTFSGPVSLAFEGAFPANTNITLSGLSVSQAAVLQAFIRLTAFVLQNTSLFSISQSSFTLSDGIAPELSLVLCESCSVARSSKFTISDSMISFVASLTSFVRLLLVVPITKTTTTPGSGSGAGSSITTVEPGLLVSNSSIFEFSRLIIDVKAFNGHVVLVQIDG